MMRQRMLCALLMPSAVLLGLVLALAPLAAHASPPAGSPQEPTADDLAMIRQQIAAARSALGKLAALQVPEPSRQELDRRIQRATEALSRYERLAQRGAPRKKAQGALFAAGAVMVADDTTLIGTIDDALLPILAVGALATLILTHGPPTVPELGQAWQEVTAAMMAVGQQAERVKREAARPRVMPARSDCKKHYERCQDTYLGKPHSGGWGKSICQQCLDRCKDSSAWPDVTPDGKPCQWWEWIGVVPPGGLPRRSTP
ncbi:MAG TPA: hypothetical protein VH877_01310 [Polyangia bacterium]|jgi:hypothetical protein|nr:hypothetical protein [Polyangia bacterium]